MAALTIQGCGQAQDEWDLDVVSSIASDKKLPGRSLSLSLSLARARALSLSLSLSLSLPPSLPPYTGSSQVSAMMGPVRRFFDQNSDLFSLQKEGGAWVVRLLE